MNDLETIECEVIEQQYFLSLQYHRARRLREEQDRQALRRAGHYCLIGLVYITAITLIILIFLWG